MKSTKEFECHSLDTGHRFLIGQLPKLLRFDVTSFNELWERHPDKYHSVKIHGRLVQTPRWQQEFGKDYHYTGRIKHALPIPILLAPLLSWAKEAIDTHLNGLLVNWYEGQLGHYIGRHRDSIKNMLEGVPIVTMSFGDERVFRLRPWRGHGYLDFPARDGTVFVMPFDTNRAWTHEVPPGRQLIGRRISVTLRGFVNHEDAFPSSTETPLG